MPFSHFKGEPRKYAIRYKNGNILEHGEGLDFWFRPFNTSIAVIDTVSQDTQFIFKESTANYQEVSIQGHLTYRFDAPLEASKLIDFTIHNGNREYRNYDKAKLDQRVINAVQSHTRKAINIYALDKALTSAKEISSQVIAGITEESSLAELGLVIESLYFTSITATPEMQKALEAEYREGLQRDADKAIYDRRAASVEEERKIQQRELDIEIEVEERRKELVTMQAENSLKLAEAEAKAEEMKLNPYGQLAPQALIGLALKEFAGNAGNIGSLNITPDMLGQVIGWMGAKGNDTDNHA